MRMLEAGGISLYYDNSKPIDFVESGQAYINYNVVLRESKQVDFTKCLGKAVKVLTPTKVEIPIGPQYLFIWMDRKIKHMANSNRKFMRRFANNPDAVRSDMAQFADSASDQELHDYISTHRMLGLAMLREYHGSRLIMVRFEQMLKKPRLIANKVQRFVGQPMDIRKMSDIVVKRPAYCLPKMLEEQIYA